MAKLAFLEDLEFEATVILIRNFVPLFGVICLSFMEGGKKIHPFLDSGPFLPIIPGESGSYIGKGDLFFPFCNCDGPKLGCPLTTCQPVETLVDVG